MIEAYLVVDEEDEDGVRAVEIHLCEYCHKDPCVWEQHTISLERWAKRNLRCEPGFMTGQRSLEMKRQQSDNPKKCFQYAARLVWGYLRKNCSREHYGCVIIGALYMFPDPEGDYMGYRGSEASVII
jgi:hypothetical protein